MYPIKKIILFQLHTKQVFLFCNDNSISFFIIYLYYYTGIKEENEKNTVYFNNVFPFRL